MRDSKSRSSTPTVDIDIDDSQNSCVGTISDTHKSFQSYASTNFVMPTIVRTPDVPPVMELKSMNEDEKLNFLGEWSDNLLPTHADKFHLITIKSKNLHAIPKCNLCINTVCLQLSKNLDIVPTSHKNVIFELLLPPTRNRRVMHIISQFINWSKSRDILYFITIPLDLASLYENEILANDLHPINRPFHEVASTCMLP